jgi:hypothetical protein
MKVKVIKKVRLEFNEVEMETILQALSYTGMNHDDSLTRKHAQQLEEGVHKALMAEAQSVNDYS